MVLELVVFLVLLRKKSKMVEQPVMVETGREKITLDSSAAAISPVPLQARPSDYCRYPPLLATYEEVVTSPTLFRETLEKVHAAMGTKFINVPFWIPTVGGRDLDLHCLFVLVTSRGGINKVLQERKWKDITGAFNFPSSATNASFEYPAKKVSNVQLSVMSKFPFNDSVWGNDQTCNLNLRLMGNKERDVIEMEREASSGSLLSDARKSNSIVRIKGDLNARNENGVANVFGGRDGRFDLKGKGIMHQRHRTGIRRRRKGGFDYGKYSSVASYDPSTEEVQDGDLHSPPSINKEGNELSEDDKVLQHYGRDMHTFNHTEETPPIMKLGQRSSSIIELREFFVEHDKRVGELEDNVQPGLVLSGEDKNTIRLLEQALEEEHATHGALYIELEKERSAAASAADEAMAMIQRLQEEKASIEMEARQYQRMIEEKYAYDAEEMNILKEIIIWREREKHFLEKEVETYRQSSNLGNENSSVGGTDILDRQQPYFDYSFDPDDDPVLMLRQLSATIDKKVTMETKTPDEVIGGGKGKDMLASERELLSQKSFAVEKQGHPVGLLSKFSEAGTDDCRVFQDKLISTDSHSYASGGDLQSSDSFYQSWTAGNCLEQLQEEITIPLGKGGEYREDMNIRTEIAKNNVETSLTQYDNWILKQNENASDLGAQSSSNMFGKESHIHDIHEVDDQAKLCDQDKGSELGCVNVNRISGISLKNYVSSEVPAVQSVGATSNCQSTGSSNAEVDFGRTSSDINSRLPPICPKAKSRISMRRNSWSDVDNERMKIDYEVGWLQERLRVVQEGREKLNLSVERRERDNMQLKLLENIAHQLQEIRQLTEPGKAMRQSSLPPPSSKVISKKRRSRSVSSSLPSTS